MNQSFAKLLFIVPMLAATLGSGLAQTVPRFDHVVIVIEENHGFQQIIGSSSAPYINSLTNQGVLFTKSFAIEHPSEPNYLDLFSGSNQGVTDDSCPHTFTTANLGAQLIAAGFTFVGFSEDLPSTGSTTCSSGAYARKHAPWVNWQGAGSNPIPSADNQPFSNFPGDFRTLPTVCIIDPNLNNDMHDGSISTGDTWLKNHLNAYVQWAKTNNSLFILTFDEDDSSQGNQIATLFIGQDVKKKISDSEHITHYSVLRTLEDMYGLAHAGNAASARTISNAWVTAAQPNFSVSVSPGSQTVTAGNSATYTVTVSPTNGFTGTVTLSASGLPAGATASFNPASIAGAGSSTLTVTTSSSTPAGTSTPNITATSGSLAHNATVTLIVNDTGTTWTTVNDTAPGITFSAGWNYSTNRNLGDYNNDIHYTKTNGNYVQYSFTGTGVEYVTETYSDEGNVDVYIDGVLQTTVSCNSATRQAQVVAYANTSLASSPHTIKVVKNGGNYMLFDAFAFVAAAATPDFTISASPSSQAVTAGNNTTYTTTINALNGFSGSVALSVSGLPTGAGGSFNPPSVSGSGASTLDITTATTTPAGTYTLTITGTNGSLVHTATVSLSVDAINTFNGIYKLQNEASGLVLNNQGSLTNGSAITQWSATSTSSNLDWTFIPITNGYYQIRSSKSGLDVAVKGASTASGAGIVQFAFGSAGNDQWKPTLNSDSSYTFINLHSGLVLGDPGASTSTSTQMDQETSNGASNQKWKPILQ